MRVFKPYIAPILLFLFSSLLVVVGAKFGLAFLQKGTCTGHYLGYSSWFSNWDGQWYQYIFEHGYYYKGDTGGYDPKVFFPLYAIIGYFVRAITGLSGELLPVVVSWWAGAIFSCAWVHYASERLKKPIDSPIVILSLALILFWPTSYFMRAAYTESLFLALLAFFFLGLTKRWPIYVLILICGLITAARPTGIICCATLALHVWLRLKDKPLILRAAFAIATGIISAWGLYGYMLYLAVDFHDPFLFASIQKAWNYGMPSDIFFQRWQEMLSLKPLWGFLINGSLQSIHGYPWNAANRLLPLLFIAALIIGIRKRWLTIEEVVFCVLSLAMIYYFGAPKNMESMGRYSLTLIPLFLIIARLVIMRTPALCMGIFAALGGLLFFYSGLFAQWYCVF